MRCRWICSNMPSGVKTREERGGRPEAERDDGLRRVPGRQRQRRRPADHVARLHSPAVPPEAVRHRERLLHDVDGPLRQPGGAGGVEQDRHGQAISDAPAAPAGTPSRAARRTGCSPSPSPPPRLLRSRSHGGSGRDRAAPSPPRRGAARRRSGPTPGCPRPRARARSARTAGTWARSPRRSGSPRSWRRGPAGIGGALSRTRSSSSTPSAWRAEPSRPTAAWSSRYVIR